MRMNSGFRKSAPAAGSVGIRHVSTNSALKMRRILYLLLNVGSAHRPDVLLIGNGSPGAAELSYSMQPTLRTVVNLATSICADTTQRQLASADRAELLLYVQY